MNEILSYKRYNKETLERMKPPQDSFEVLENTFSVASPGERAYMHTEELFDCKAIFLRNVQTRITLLAHLSCVADLNAVAQGWVNQVTTNNSSESVEITLFTGSAHDPENDVDTPAFDSPGLWYPSTETLQSSLLDALNEKVASVKINTAPSDTPRAIAINIATGKYYEVDSMAGDGARADVSRNQIIEPSLQT